MHVQRHMLRTCNTYGFLTVVCCCYTLYRCISRRSQGSDGTISGRFQRMCHGGRSLLVLCRRTQSRRPRTANESSRSMRQTSPTFTDQRRRTTDNLCSALFDGVLLPPAVADERPTVRTFRRRHDVIAVRCRRCSRHDAVRWSGDFAVPRCQRRDGASATCGDANIRFNSGTLDAVGVRQRDCEHDDDANGRQWNVFGRSNIRTFQKKQFRHERRTRRRR
jgi:hypothetical protein